MSIERSSFEKCQEQFNFYSNSVSITIPGRNNTADPLFKMRLLYASLLGLLPALSLAAKRSSSSTDVYETYRAKSLSTPSLTVDDSIFNELTSAPRNYSTVICLTALDARFGCNMCHTWKPEWDLLAKTWVNGDKGGQTRMLFGQLDFLDGKQTFESLQLQTAPVLLLYPPTTGPNAKPNAQPARFDFGTGGPPSAESVHSWLSRQLPESVPTPRFSRPLNYVKIATVTTGVLGTLTLTFVAWPYMMPVLQNRNLWAGLCILFILIFTSGYMFNQIRGTPYVGGNGKGGISYFAPGFQNQYGLESQIVATIYGVLSLATIALALIVPRMSNPQAQNAAVIAWGAIIYGTYSFLLSTFRMKNGGYPLHLPPF